MTVKLLTEHHLEILSLKGGCTGSSESAHVKCHIVGNLMPWLKCTCISGLNKKYKTKNEVLRHNAQTRIRSYFTTVSIQKF